MRVFAEAEYEEAAEEHGLRDKLAALEELCEAQVGACLAACCRARASAWFAPSGAEQDALRMLQLDRRSMLVHAQTLNKAACMADAGLLH